MTRRKITRKMKLTVVRDTVNGVPRIGCRATGIYKGNPIEYTAAMPVKNLDLPDAMSNLERLATGLYNRECRIIDGIDDPDPTE